MILARVFQAPFETTFRQNSVKSSFVKTGICPFDPNAIDKSQLYPSNVLERPQGASTSTSPVTAQDLIALPLVLYVAMHIHH